MSPDSIAAALLAWFGGRHRDVPWRDERDPYRILVAEVMAQQTRIATVAPYYAAFIDRFPTAADLAAASVDEVLKIWEGLGYYARARHLHAAAGQIVAEHAGRVPSTVDGLRSLAGVGAYTAGAVASIAFGIAEPAVDGNARRVLSRVYDLADPSPTALDRAARSLLDANPGRSASLNQAIMDLGGAICVPRDPRCGVCPVSDDCLARARGTVAERPPPRGRTPVPDRHAAAAIVGRRGRILIVRRPEQGLLGGLWDLPATEPATAPGRADRLAAHLRDDLGVEAAIEQRLHRVRHSFSHFRLRLDVYAARWLHGEAPASRRTRWARTGDLRELALPTYLRPVFRRED